MLKRFRESDILLWVAVGLLLTIGLLTLSSALSHKTGSSAMFQRQLIFVVLAMVMAMVLSLIDYRVWADYSVVLYGGLMVLLIGLLVLGKATRGAQSWVNLAGVTFQPSEFIKPVALLMACQFLTLGRQTRLTSRKFVGLSLILGVPAMLVLLQPDLGTALGLFMIFSALIVFSDLEMKELLILGAVFLVVISLVGGAGWKWGLKDYQKARITSFMNPEADLKGSGYQVHQSKIAVGSGGLKGKGLFEGTQTRNKFLPEAHTDFIFAVWAEETGFVGSTLVLCLFAFILYRIIRIGQLARDSLGLYLCVGVAAILVYHLTINIGMVLGVVPTTGIPLPFFSFGRSAMLATMLAIALVQSVKIRRFVH